MESINGVNYTMHYHYLVGLKIECLILSVLNLDAFLCIAQAKSGSKAFVAGLEGEESEVGGGPSSNIIGQFGVGFYSTFMVGNKVTVYSQSAEPDAGTGHVWESDGSGRYVRARGCAFIRAYAGPST